MVHQDESLVVPQLQTLEVLQEQEESIGDPVNTWEKSPFLVQTTIRFPSKNK